MEDMVTKRKRSVLKRHQVRVSFNEDSKAGLAKMKALFPGLEEHEVVRMMVCGVLESAKAMDFKLELPLEISIRKRGD
jgi:hypothetical protein